MTNTLSVADKIRESREAGYSDDEIASIASEKVPGFKDKFSQSLQSGYTPSQVLDFLSQPEEKKKNFSDMLAGGSRLGFMAAKGYALTQPAVLVPELAGQAMEAYASAPSIQSLEMQRAARDEIEHMLEQKSLSPAEWTPQDEERLEEFRKISQMGEQEFQEKGMFYEPFSIAPTTLLKKGGQFIGIDTEAKNVLEKTFEFIPMLAKKAPEAALSQSYKYLGQSSIQKIGKDVISASKEAMKTAPVILPAALAEDSLGIEMEKSLIGYGVFHASKEVGKFAVSKAGKKWFLFDPTNLEFRNFRKSYQEELKNAPKYVEEQVRNGLMKAKTAEQMMPFLDKAIEMDIPITPNTLVNSSYFRNVERLIAENEISGENLTEFLQKTSKNWAEVSQKALKTMETDLQFSTPGATSEALMTDVVRKRQQDLITEYKNLYDTSSKSLSKSKNISETSREEIKESIDDVLEMVGKSLFQTIAQKEAKLIGKEAKKKLSKVGEEINKNFQKDINGKTLVDSIKSLNSVIDWENPNVVNLYAKTRSKLIDILKKEYGSSHGKALKELEQANLKYGESQKLFGKDSKWKKWGINEDTNSDDLLKTLNTVEKLKSFEKDFSGTGEGKKYIDHFKHRKAQEILDPIFDMKDYTPGKVSNALHKLKRNAYFRHLIPEETWKNLDQIASLDALIERRSKGFFRQKEPREPLSLWVGIGNAIQKAALNLGINQSKKVRAAAFSEFFLDPSYSSKAKTILTDIANEMAKPNPNIKKVNEYKALLQNIGNDLSQIGRAGAIQSLEGNE